MLVLLIILFYGPIAAGTYTYTVTGIDGNGCEATDQISVVVTAAPKPFIGGDTSVCCTIAKSYCDMSVSENDIYGDPNPNYDNTIGPFTYQWTISGGVIQSGANSGCVEVKWNCNCTHGWLQLTKTNTHTGCVTTTGQFGVTIHQLPVPVIAGNTTVYTTAVGEVYSVPEVAGHLYSWTVEGGTITAGWRYSFNYS